METLSMSVCKMCAKTTPKGLDFCSQDCMNTFKSKQKPKGKKFSAPNHNYENQMLRNGKGLKVELQMSRGPPVRGILMNYDPEFQKLAVMEDLGNTQKKLTFVKLNYVSALSLYGEKLGNED